MTDKTVPLYIPAKACYEHLGGKLGELFLERIIALGWITKSHPEAPHYHVTTKGEEAFGELGLDLSQIKKEHWPVA